MSKITVDNVEITISKKGTDDYISLTDIVASHEEGSRLIEKWLSNKNTIEYLGVWEVLNNPNFNSPEFGGIKNEAGSNRFTMSAKKWIEKTGATGIMAKAGRYGGTYAHKDIAFEFCTWISPLFKFMVIREYQRMKESEADSIEWNYRRFLSKVNYKLHTASIKDNLIPTLGISKEQESFVYADEAEILNLAVFGITSKEWRFQNPEMVLRGLNIRDVANLIQLTVLTNLETHNAEFNREGVSARDRFIKLREIAINQLRSLSEIEYEYPIESPHKLRN